MGNVARHASPGQGGEGEGLGRDLTPSGSDDCGPEENR